MVIPVNLELGNSGLLYKNMTHKFGNVRFHWWIFLHFWVFIVVVHIVTNSEELLVVVGAGEQKSSHTNYFNFWKSGSFWSRTLNYSIEIYKMRTSKTNFIWPG